MSRVDAHLIGILLLPFLLRAANPNWLFNTPFSIDPWVYFGYFRNLSLYKASWFPNLYYGSRLPWILSGYVLQRLFEVVTAQQILHLGVYLSAAVPFYWLSRECLGRRSAFFVTILFGCQPAILLATGWDYVDGPGCALTLVALAFALRAGKSSNPIPWLIVEGVAAAAMLYTNLVLLLFFPGILGFYLFPRAKAINWDLARIGLYGSLWIGLGMFAVTVVFALINHRLDGSYFFYAPSLQYAANTVRKTNVWSKADLSWLSGAYWLVLPAIGVATTIGFLSLGLIRRSLRWNDTRVLFCANYLACFGAMLAWELNKGYAFEFGFYVSYLVGPLFLSIGSQIAPALDSWSRTLYWTMIVFFLAALVIPYKLIGQSVMTVSNPNLLYLILIGITGVALRILWPQRGLSLLAPIVVFAWLHYILIAYGWFVFIRAPRSDNVASLRRVAESVDQVRLNARGERPIFWYSRSEEYGVELWAINASYLWSWTYIGYEFPKIEPGRKLEPGTLVVIPTSMPRDVLLDRVSAALEPLNLQATVETSKDVGGRYSLWFVRIHDLRSVAVHGIQDTTGMKLVETRGKDEGLPGRNWILCEYPTSRSSLTRKNSGVLITTASHHDAYASKYSPLTAAQAGTYRFKLTYRVVRGSLVFGALSADESHWIAHGTPLSFDRDTRVDVMSVHLDAGERLVLITSNAASESSTFELQSLNAVFSADQPR